MYKCVIATAKSFLALLFTVFTAFQSHGADVVSEFEIGTWSGAAYEENGAFSYCIVGRSSGNKYLMMLRAPSVGYAFGVYDPAGPFKANATYNTRTTIDDRWILEAEGAGASSNLLRIVIPDFETGAALEHFAAGNRIRIYVGGKRWLSVSLKGSRNALGGLERCYSARAPAIAAPEPSAAIVEVRLSRTTKRLIRAIGLPLPSGTLQDLRIAAESFEPGALIVLGLALIDMPEHAIYQDEGSSFVSLAADAGDAKGLYVLGRLMQLNLTDKVFDGQGQELINEAADLDLPQALVDRARWRRATDLSAALEDLRKASGLGHNRASELLAEWQPQGTQTREQPEQPVANVPQAPQVAEGPRPPETISVSVADPVIELTQPQFDETDQVQVRYYDLPSAGVNWIAIAGKDHAPDQYFDLLMLPETKTSGTHRFKQLPAGEYQVRLYLNWPYGEYVVVSAAPVEILAKEQAPAVADDPAPSPAYRKVGNLICSGEASYPDAWKSEAKCRPNGCFFGVLDLDACLARADTMGATIVLHGVADGLRSNECWMQTSCSGLTEHPDYAAFRLEELSAPPAVSLLDPKNSNGAPEPAAVPDGLAGDMPDAFLEPETAQPPENETKEPPAVDDAQQPASSDYNLIIAIQSLLSARGSDIGIPNGQLNAATVAAIRVFQREVGLPADGLATLELRDAIIAAGLQSPSEPPATGKPGADAGIRIGVAPDTAPDTPPKPVVAQAEEEKEPVSAPAVGGYVGPLCKDPWGKYTVDIVDSPSFTCYFDPPQTVNIAPGDPRTVTCAKAEIHNKESNRTLKECSAKRGSTFTFPIRDGSAECYSARFYPDGKLQECEFQYSHPLVEVKTLGQTFKCASAKFDEEERLTSCRGEVDQGGLVSLPTGHDVPVTCTTVDFMPVRFAEGRLVSCRLGAEFTSQWDGLRFSCPAGSDLKFDDNGRLPDVESYGCTAELASALGPATETLLRSHPEPGPTDLKELRICKTRADDCALDEPRWIAVGPQGDQQLLCEGRVRLFDNPGYLRECETTKPPTLETPLGRMACPGFKLGQDGQLTECTGAEDSPMPIFKTKVDEADLSCLLNGSDRAVSFWSGGKLQACVLEKTTVIPVGDGSIAISCAANSEAEFWPGGGLASCTTDAAQKVGGPFGGDAVCAAGEVKLLPDGRLRHCTLAPDEEMQVALPDGQQVACVGELEMHLNVDKKTGDTSGESFGACDSFTAPADLVSGEETYSCWAAAFYPAAKGGGLKGCLTAEMDRFEVDLKKTLPCGRSDVLALVFRTSGSLRSVGRCEE